MMTATYSPDDNKLRLYSATRLDKETYERVRAAGFRWAPKQELFVAPMWTPDREDLLIELCGEIDDEDTTLAERAEERAERFEDYSAKRLQDAERAKKAVDAIADNIPFGQPILVGHHSERHARKDAERIENGMRKTVQMWKTSQYWTDRAAGALRHAKYKELPSVRARRIKKIESDRRRQEKTVKESKARIWLWSNPTKLTKNGQAVTLPEAVIFLAGDDRILDNATPEEVCARAIAKHQARIDWAQRWIDHYDNRLAYERAMMAEAGGIASDKVTPEKGGAVKCWASPRGGWSYIVKVNKVTVTVRDNWGRGGPSFTRNIPFDKLSAVMSKAQVDEERADGALIETEDKTGFYISAPASETPKPAAEAVYDSGPPVREEINYTPKPDDSAFRALDQQLSDAKRELRPVVTIVAAPQLFPTPPALAARMVAELGDVDGKRVLEPSAGTGNLAVAVLEAGGKEVLCYEINYQLAKALRGYGFDAINGDFLEQDPSATQFDAVVMNPPFENGADIQHIQHAFKFLKPGGRLVALCANGPRQQAKLGALVEANGGVWEDLPEGTFAEAGTNVRVALLTIDKAA